MEEAALRDTGTGSKTQMTIIKRSSPITGLDRPKGFQEVEAPRFLDKRHRKVVGFQPYVPAAFSPQEMFLVLISVRG
jgi:hypothetical protein